LDITAPASELEAVRVRRAELRETLDALEDVLSTDTATRGELDVALERLSAEFALHVEVTEGPNGLHQAILAGDLRLANQVDALAAEHAEIAAAIDALIAAPGGVAQLRQPAEALVAQLVKHRQRGAELIYEAYETDIGGDG
jgi:hypothetical protein